MFARARENARKSNCASNLKQIGLGAMQYTQDYDECLVHYSLPGIGSWTNALAPYLKNTGVFGCPSYKTYWLGYAYNYYYLGNGTTSTAMASIQSPSDTVAFADASKYDTGADYPGASHINPPHQVTYTYISRPAWRHSDGCNVTFVDGHTKWYKADSAFYPATAPLGTWAGNGITLATDPNYKNQMWDLQ